MAEEAKGEDVSEEPPGQEEVVAGTISLMLQGNEHHKKWTCPRLSEWYNLQKVTIENYYQRRDKEIDM